MRITYAFLIYIILSVINHHSRIPGVFASSSCISSYRLEGWSTELGSVILWCNQLEGNAFVSQKVLPDLTVSLNGSSSL